MIILGVNMTVRGYSKFILYAAEYINLYPDTWQTCWPNDTAGRVMLDAGVG